MSVTDSLEFNEELKPCILTDKEETKLLPCRTCKRPCVVNVFASPLKTECTECRPKNGGSSRSAARTATLGQEVDISLEVEVLTDKTPTKTIPCRKCRRGCVVTVFQTPEKTECSACRGNTKKERHEKVLQEKAHTVDPATLENLRDGIINPHFKTLPLCPFNPDHDVELKSVTHSSYYGPRHLHGYNAKGVPMYDQETGESVMYQCNECMVVISFSTMHQVPLRAQNETRRVEHHGPTTLTLLQGVRDNVA